MKIKFLFAWYDLWVGLFWDRDKKKLYIFPFPTLGIVVGFPVIVKCRFCKSVLKNGIHDVFWWCINCNVNEKYNPLTKQFFYASTDEENRQLEINKNLK